MSHKDWENVEFMEADEDVTWMDIGLTFLLAASIFLLATII